MNVSSIKNKQKIQVQLPISVVQYTVCTFPVQVNSQHMLQHIQWYQFLVFGGNNRLHFWGLSTCIISCSNRVLYGVCRCRPNRLQEEWQWVRTQVLQGLRQNRGLQSKEGEIPAVKTTMKRKSSVRKETHATISEAIHSSGDAVLMSEVIVFLKKSSYVLYSSY